MTCFYWSSVWNRTGWVFAVMVVFHVDIFNVILKFCPGYLFFMRKYGDKNYKKRCFFTSNPLEKFRKPLVLSDFTKSKAYYMLFGGFLKWTLFSFWNERCPHLMNVRTVESWSNWIARACVFSSLFFSISALFMV